VSTGTRATATPDAVATAAAVADALTRLGPTRDDVVDALLALGITGAIGDPTECPVARYLDDCFPGTRYEVSACDVYDRFTLLKGDGPIYVHPPLAVELFIDAFDRGAFPELVRTRD
jgi:hypothetical protein